MMLCPFPSFSWGHHYKIKTQEKDLSTVVGNELYLWIQENRNTDSLQACWCSFLHSSKAEFHTHLRLSHIETHSIQVYNYRGIFRKEKIWSLNRSK